MPIQDSAAVRGDQPPPHPKPETKVLSLLLKVAIMILLTTLFFVFLGLATALLLIHLCVASALHRRRRGNRRRSQFRDSSSGFSHGDLRKLLQFRFSNWVNPHSQIDCPICLDGFRKGQWCRKLGGCGHVYHRKCIDSWLIRVSACPLCRSCVRLDMEQRQVDSPVQLTSEDSSHPAQCLFSRRRNHYVSQGKITPEEQQSGPVASIPVTSSNSGSGYVIKMGT